MKNFIVCKSCSAQNPFYSLICPQCKSYLRERIYNIDLWTTIGLLIENPSKAFKTIIFSEHKNYLILLLILISGKMFLNGIFLTVFFNKWNAYLPGYFFSYLIILVSTVIMILIFAGIFGWTSKIVDVKTKFRDNLAILTYSFFPYTVGFLLLFPIELIIFGETLFYYTPSPFLLKSSIAYTLLAFESILILWSLFLTYSALKVQAVSKIYSLAFTFFIHITFYLILYFISSSVYL